MTLFVVGFVALCVTVPAGVSLVVLRFTDPRRRGKHARLGWSA